MRAMTSTAAVANAIATSGRAHLFDAWRLRPMASATTRSVDHSTSGDELVARRPSASRSSNCDSLVIAQFLSEAGDDPMKPRPHIRRGSSEVDRDLGRIHAEQILERQELSIWVVRSRWRVA